MAAGNMEEYSEIERSKVGIMRALVEREDPSAKEVDDLMIRRFLRAQELNIEKASALFLKCLSWKREFMPKGFIPESEIPNELEQSKCFAQGLDKMGRPILVIFSGRHRPNKTTAEETKRLVVYTFEKICARMMGPQENFLAIVDLKGWGYANSDVRAYISTLSILQDYYPERLGKLLMVHVPYIFMTAWKIVCPFIDSNTKKKIAFIENKMLSSTLLGEIDESQLPDVYGGKLPLVPIQRY